MILEGWFIHLLHLPPSHKPSSCLQSPWIRKGFPNLDQGIQVILHLFLSWILNPRKGWHPCNIPIVWFLMHPYKLSQIQPLLGSSPRFSTSPAHHLISWRNFIYHFSMNHASLELYRPHHTSSLLKTGFWSSMPTISCPAHNSLSSPKVWISRFIHFFPQNQTPRTWASSKVQYEAHRFASFGMIISDPTALPSKRWSPCRGDLRQNRYYQTSCPRMKILIGLQNISCEMFLWRNLK